MTERVFTLHADEAWPWMSAVPGEGHFPTDLRHLDITDEENTTYHAALSVVMAMQKRLERAWRDEGHFVKKDRTSGLWYCRCGWVEERTEEDR